MGAYAAGMKAYEQREDADDRYNPHDGKPSQAWLAKQWELGWYAGHAEMVEAADDYRIANWEDNRSWGY